MDLALVIAFAAAVFVLSVAPGPDMLFVVANAAAGGRRAGLVAAVGMSTGLAVHTMAAAVGWARSCKRLQPCWTVCASSGRCC